MSYAELVTAWARADVTARAYELTWTGTRRPEREYLIAELRRAADAWERLAFLEARHMQQRMPRV